MNKPGESNTRNNIPDAPTYSIHEFPLSAVRVSPDTMRVMMCEDHEWERDGEGHQTNPGPVIGSLIRRGSGWWVSDAMRDNLGARRARDLVTPWDSPRMALAIAADFWEMEGRSMVCLLYTSPSPRNRTRSRMPSSA